MTTSQLWAKTLRFAVFICISSMFLSIISIIINVTVLIKFSTLLMPLGIVGTGIYILFNKKRVTDADEFKYFCTNSMFLSIAAYMLIIAGIGIVLTTNSI